MSVHLPSLWFALITDVSSSTDLNAQQSPLLRLPAEIRNRIYELVLGGKRIHVRPREDGRPTVCKINLADKDMGDLVDAHQSDVANNRKAPTKGWIARHEACVDHRGQDLPVEPFCLSLLQACKQIHHEAALLPYQLNTFVFPRVYILYSFVKALHDSQKHAITALALYTAEIPVYKITGWGSLEKLASLTTLTLIVETHTPSQERDEEAAVSALSRIFSEQALNAVRVCAFVVRDAHPGVSPRMESMRIQKRRKWASQFKAALLGGGGEVDGEVAPQ